MKALVTARTVYGVTKFYPACDIARGFAKIAGTKTLTMPVLKQIKAMGVDLVIDSEETTVTMLKQSAHDWLRQAV